MSKNKVAIVTGSSRGIGAEIALRLAGDGYDLTVNYAGNADKAGEIVKAVKERGREAIAVRGDVANADDVAGLFRSTAERFGKIDAVVNCAGILSMGRIADGDIQGFDKVIAVNLRGAFLVMSEAARHIADGGRIVAISSSVIAHPFPAYGPYIASKAGVEGLVRVLANELRGRNVTVNAVAPGPVATELFLHDKTAEQIDYLSKMAPLERLGQPSDIANAVSFLLSPDGGWINAQILRANGGFS